MHLRFFWVGVLNASLHVLIIPEHQGDAVFMQFVHSSPREIQQATPALSHGSVTREGSRSESKDLIEVMSTVRTSTLNEVAAHSPAAE